MDSFNPPEKVDIFGNKPGTGFAGSGPDGSLQKANVMGSFAAPGSGGAAQARGTASQGQAGAGSPQRAQAMFGRLQAQMPNQAIGQARGAIQQGQDKLQSEANSFMTQAGEDAKRYTITDSELNGAGLGYANASARVAKQFANTQAETYKPFEGLGDKIPNADNLMNSNQIYRGTVGAQYTKGQGNFDGALLDRNPDFRRIREQTQAGARALQKQNDDLKASQTADAQAMQQKALTDANIAAKTTLRDKNVQSMALAEEKAKAEGLRREGLDKSKIGGEQYDRLLGNLQEDFRGDDPMSDRSRGVNGDYGTARPDLSQFVKINGQVSGSQMMGQHGVDQYNNIQNLVGEGGQSLSYDPAGMGEDYSFDDAGAQRAILDDRTLQHQTAKNSQYQKFRDIGAGYQLPQGDVRTPIPEYDPWKIQDMKNDNPLNWGSPGTRSLPASPPVVRERQAVEPQGNVDDNGTPEMSGGGSMSLHGGQFRSSQPLPAQGQLAYDPAYGGPSPEDNGYRPRNGTYRPVPGALPFEPIDYSKLKEGPDDSPGSDREPNRGSSHGPEGEALIRRMRLQGGRFAR